MDPAALARRLEAVEGRLAGSDAERRAAALWAAEARAAGRRPRTTTLWVRPRRAAARALYALLGVAASVVAVPAPEVGLGLAVGALAAALLEAGGLPVLSLLQVRRATQNVVAAPSGERGSRVLLIVAAAVDAPRDSVLARLEHARPGRRAWPGPAAWLLLGLAGVAACAAARLAGAEGAGIGAVQLVPSVVLIVLLGAYAEAALAGPLRRCPAGGPAAAIAVAAALDAAPPRRLAVELVLAGAGAEGMRAHVAARRRELAAEDVVVLELRSGEGPVRAVVRAGEHLPVRLHPQLVALAEALPDAELATVTARTPARVARAARWPAIALEGEARGLAGSALRLIAAIDRELAQAQAARGR